MEDDATEDEEGENMDTDPDSQPDSSDEEGPIRLLSQLAVCSPMSVESDEDEDVEG